MNEHDSPLTDTAIGMGAAEGTTILPDAIRNMSTPLAWEQADDGVVDYPPTGSEALERLPKPYELDEPQSWWAAWSYAATLLSFAVVIALVVWGVWTQPHDSKATMSPVSAGVTKPEAAQPVPVSPTSTPPPVVGAPPLDGTYQLTNKWGETLMWDGFRSACRPSGCTAAGLRLDNDDPTAPYSPEFAPPFFLRWSDGRWQGAYRFDSDCGTPGGHSDRGRSTKSWAFALEPQPNGTYRGTVTITTVKADPTKACQPEGDVYTMPFTAVRTGPPPLGVVADPPTG